MSDLRAYALMTVVGLAGGALVAAIGAPAGWLSGAMLATAGLALAGHAKPLPGAFRWVAMILSGIVIGSAASPEVLAGMSAYPASLAMMMASVTACTLICALFLARLEGWSWSSAFFASVPGALSYVFAVAGRDESADLRRIAVVQVLRVFLLMGLAPLAVAELGVLPAKPPTIETYAMAHLAWMLPLGAALGLGLERLKVAGGLLFGAMVVSGLAHGMGFVHGRPPLLAALGAQAFLGIWVGARFIGFDRAMLTRSALAAIGAFALAMGVSALFAEAASLWLHVPFAQTMIAFSPGGLEAMTLLAFALGLDPLYAAAHHLARFFLIAALLPGALALWRRFEPTRNGDKA